jgi:hypothetical protein
MTHQGDPSKGPRWIVDQIAAAFESSRGAAPGGARLSRPDVNGLVAELLEEELERLAGEKEPSPPAPLPRAGEG